jgi:hypothetical protein
MRFPLHPALRALNFLLDHAVSIASATSPVSSPTRLRALRMRATSSPLAAICPAGSPRPFAAASSRSWLASISRKIGAALFFVWENRGQTGRFRFRAIVVFLARGSVRTRHRSGYPHHVTQRGNARQFILTTDAERLVYLDLLRHYCTLHWLALVGYCLRSNHVHLMVIRKPLDSSLSNVTRLLN